MSLFLIVAIVVLVLFLIVAISISSNSFMRFKQVYDKFLSVKNSAYISSRQFAEFVRDSRLDGRLGIITRDKDFSDAYDYASNTLILNKKREHDSSISALAIVSHELGHAMQRKQGTKKFKRCTKIRKFVSIASKFITPLFLAGVVCLFFEDLSIFVGAGLCAAAVVLFFVLLVYKMRLLAVEKEASNFGLQLLEELDILEDIELKNIKQVLDAAFMTYVGDFFRAMLSWTGLTKKAAKP